MEWEGEKPKGPDEKGEGGKKIEKRRGIKKMGTK